MTRGLQLCLLVLLLGGCSALPPFEKDTGPSKDIDLSGIKEPVPRAEPFSKSGNPDSYIVRGRRYYTLRSNRGYRERGIASWYGKKFHGRRTSNGEVYDMYAHTAAHKTLPLPTYARVTNLENGSSAIVRINDRGPFHENRLIDLSYVTAKKLGIVAKGTGWVEVTAIDAGAPQSLPVPVAGPRSGQIFLQVGAFQERSNAERLGDRLRAANFQPIYIATDRLASGQIFRVRLGPLFNPELADRLSRQLANLGIEQPHIVVE